MLSSFPQPLIPVSLTNLISSLTLFSPSKIPPSPPLRQTRHPPDPLPLWTARTSSVRFFLIPIWACASSPVTANQHFCSPTPATWHRMGQRLSPGWHPTLSYISPTGAVEHSTVIEVARWLQDHPPPPSIPAIVLPPHPASLVPEPLVVPARTLRPRRRLPPASSTPATAPLPRLPIRRSRSRSSSALMPPASAPPTPRRSPRFTAMRCATIPVASAGGLLPSPRSVPWSEPPVNLAVPPTPSSRDTVFFIERVPSRWRRPLPFIPGLLYRLPRLKHPRGSRPQSLSSRPRRPGPPPSSTSTSSAGPLPFVRLSLVPTETSGDKQTATSWLNSSRLHAP
jgi:hypothetical protein